MADIAQIGFAANTDGLVKADAALNKLIPTAKKVENAANDVAGALGNVANASEDVAQVTNISTAAFDKAVRSELQAAAARRKVADAAKGQTDASNKQAAANDNVAKSARGLSNDAKNLSFQIVDVTQGLASGQPVFQIFAQQAGQIGQVIATSPQGLGGLMKELGKAISSVITVSRLAIGALAGLAIGFLAAANNVIQGAKAIDDLSKSTDVAIPRLRALQQAASIKGIDADSFSEGIKGFANSVYDAQHNLGSLRGLMIANGQSAKDLQGYLEKVADLVARTSSGVQKQKILREAGLPSDAAWVRFMEQGSAAIRAAAANGVEFNNSAEQNLIKKAREFDEAWAKAVNNMTNNFKAAMVSIVDALSNVKVPDWVGKLAAAAAQLNPVTAAASAAAKLAGKATGIGQGPSFSDRFSGDGANTAANNIGLQQGLNKKAGIVEPKTQAELLAANQQAQQRISILGELASVTDKVKLKQLELDAAGLQGVGVTKQQAAAIINMTRAQEEMNRVQQQATLGIYNEQAARKAATDTLQSWIDKGLVDKNNTEQMAAAQLVLANNLRATKDAAELAAAPLKQLKQFEQDASDLRKVLDSGVTGALNNLVSPIQDVLNGVTSLGDGFRNVGVIVLKAIQEMIIKMLILAPIAKSLQGIFSGFNPLAGAFSFGGGSAKGNAFDGPRKFAQGGAFTNKIFDRPTLFSYANGSKFGEMGEAGAEAVMPLKRGPNGSLGVQMYGQRANNDNSSSVVIAPVYQIGGNVSQADLAEVKRTQADFQRQLPGMVINAQRNANKRNVRG